MFDVGEDDLTGLGQWISVTSEKSMYMTYNVFGGTLNLAYYHKKSVAVCL